MYDGTIYGQRVSVRDRSALAGKLSDSVEIRIRKKSDRGYPHRGAVPIRPQSAEKRPGGFLPGDSGSNQIEHLRRTGPITTPGLVLEVGSEDLRHMLAVEASHLKQRPGQADRHMGVVGVAQTANLDGLAAKFARVHVQPAFKRSAECVSNGDSKQSASELVLQRVDLFLHLCRTLIAFIRQVKAPSPQVDHYGRPIMVDDCSALLYTIPVGGALRDTGVRLRSHKLETNVPSIKEQRRVSYVPLENAAQRLQVTVDELLDFHTRGWIYVIHGEEARFLHGCDEYKARFILHLRRSRGLEDHEISTVLLAQEPPYSLDAVDEILAKAGTSGAIPHASDRTIA